MRLIIALFSICFIFNACSSKPKLQKPKIVLSTKKVKSGKPAVRDFPLSKDGTCPSRCESDVTSVYEAITLPDGNKRCALKFTVPCHPFGCDSEGVACATQCNTPEDCSSGASCHSQSGQCVTIATPVCSDEWTLMSPTGFTETCHGYRCIINQCLPICHEDKDCMQGYECLKGRCVED